MATITNRTGTIETVPARDIPMRDIKEKDKTLVVDRIETNSTAIPRGVATPVVHRPRTSFLATVSLIFGVVAALAVLTGTLAGPGVGLGVLAAFAGLGGMAATSRSHVAGKGDALLGMLFGLAAVVLGVLALTGVLSWLSADTNTVAGVSDWLQARVPWLFRS